MIQRLFNTIMAAKRSEFLPSTKRQSYYLLFFSNFTIKLSLQIAHKKSTCKQLKKNNPQLLFHLTIFQTTSYHSTLFFEYMKIQMNGKDRELHEWKISTQQQMQQMFVIMGTGESRQVSSFTRKIHSITIQNLGTENQITSNIIYQSFSHPIFIIYIKSSIFISVIFTKKQSRQKRSIIIICMVGFIYKNIIIKTHPKPNPKLKTFPMFHTQYQQQFHQQTLPSTEYFSEQGLSGRMTAFVELDHKEQIVHCVGTQKYCLPLAWTIAKRYSQKKSKVGENKSIPKTSTLRYEGILTHQNGRPLDLFDSAFILPEVEKKLDQFYQICRKGYFVKFVYTLQGDYGGNSNNNNNTEMVEQNISIKSHIKSQYLHQQQSLPKQLLQKLSETQTNLLQFLTKLGIISVRDKSLNRYQQILRVMLAKKCMRDVLDLHKKPYQPQSQFLGYSSLSNKNSMETSKKQQKNTYTQSAISTVQSSQYPTQAPPTSSPSDLKSRKCCSLEYKKQQKYFPEVTEQNNPIVKVRNIFVNIKDKNGDILEEAFGGYFTVRNYETLVEIQNKLVEVDMEPQGDEQGDLAGDQQKNKNVNIQYNQLFDSQNEEQDNGGQKIGSCNSIMEDQNENQRQNKDHQMIIQQQQKQKNSQIYECNLQLAIKTLNPELQNDEKSLKKVQREMQIISKIKNNDYICRYFQCQGQILFQSQPQQSLPKSLPKSTSLVMQKLTLSLKQILTQHLYSNPFLITKQLTKSLLALHSSGIVHRDIKPGNIMFNEYGELKLIDFSESIECWRRLRENGDDDYERIGFTLPYSPFQCARLCEEGYSNMRIDNWSLGMTVSEVMLGALPVCYSKSLKSSIKEKWGTGEQFHWCMNLRAWNFNTRLLLPIKILCLKLMEFDWKNRLCLQSFLGFLQYCQKDIITI